MPIDIRQLDAEVEIVADPQEERAEPGRGRAGGATRRELEELVRQVIVEELQRMLRQGSGS
jgi:hypothetical protein